MKKLFILLLLSLSIGAGSHAQNLFLNQNGDVGIGTKTPSARLDVTTTSENVMRIIGVNPYLLFRDVYDASPREAGFLRAWTTDPTNPAGYHGLEIGVPSQSPGQLPKHLLFSTNYAIRMAILNNGNVGIGTTNPTHKLEVAGNTRLAGPSLFEGSTHFVGTTYIEGSAFNGIVGIYGSAVNSLVNITNTANESTGSGLNVRSQDNYGTIQATNSRESFYGGPAILARTLFGRYSGHFQGGRILVEGGDDGAHSGGIEFVNLKTFSSGFPTTQAYVGMRDNNELGIYGFPLGDWILRMNIYSGSICSRSAIALCSDQRLKRDFEPLTGSLTKLTSVQGQHYFWKEAKMPGLQTGFVAQEVQKVFPELVRTDDTGFLSVDYTGFVPHLVEAVKELKTNADQITQRLVAENETLRSQLEQVMKGLAALESQSLGQPVASMRK